MFPVRFPLPTAILYIRNHKYGNGVDSTPRVRDDRWLCEALHHVPVPSGDCHFDSDVWADSMQRAQYEMRVLAGARDGGPSTETACPMWQYRSGAEIGPCIDDREVPLVSCDHFGSASSGWRDDPQTPEFEGLPVECGTQRDAKNSRPMAGFWMVPQITPGIAAYVRACLPFEPMTDGSCGPWVLVDWR